MPGDPWEALLRPTGRRVVSILLAGPQTLTQLSEATRLSKPSLLAQLKKLEAIGILTKTVSKTAGGREARYELGEACLHIEVRPGAGVVLSWASAGPYDPEFPLAAQIRAPDARSEVLVVLRHLRRAVPRALPHITIILFGSVARGEATWKSDIDLLFVGDPAWLAAPANIGPIENALADVQETLTHPVRLHRASRDDVFEEVSPLMRSVREEGVIIHAPAKEVELWKAVKRYEDIRI